MSTPNQEQIRKYLEWVNGLSAHFHLRYGDQPYDPDIGGVRQWLERLVEHGHEPHWCIRAYHAACFDVVKAVRQMQESGEVESASSSALLDPARWAEARVLACEQCRSVYEAFKKEDARDE